MQVAAKLKYARISPQKCRLVADMVRGKPVGQALSTLRFTPKKGAELVRKVLESAIANAENNHNADIDALKVDLIYIDEAPTPEAVPCARQGPRQPHRQAQQPHHDPRRRRPQGLREPELMGQKVNPVGIRLGITRDWTSKWYANKRTFPIYILQDWQVREFLKKKLAEASVSRIHIERAARKANITIHTARPGVVIGKKGEDIERLRQEVAKLMKMGFNDVRLNIAEIRKPELDAQLVAEGIAQQVERRVMFRRAMKRAVMNTMRSGALGVKVRLSGRLNGSEIARTEWTREGRIPLHTFRADIDYGTAEARTTYGVIGVKVWIFKGEVFDQPVPMGAEVEATPAAEQTA